jgi:hypothetical protein
VLYGTTAVVHDGFDERRVASAIQEDGITIVSMVATMLQRLLDADDRPVPPSLRIVLVIHSFFVPSFRLKQDILPERDIPAWFQATKTGRFEAPCAELCGPGHSGMKGWVNVHTDEDYQKWVKEQWPAS